MMSGADTDLSIILACLCCTTPFFVGLALGIALQPGGLLSRKLNAAKQSIKQRISQLFLEEE